MAQDTDDQSYDEITAMLSMPDQPGADSPTEDETWTETYWNDHPAAPSPLAEQHSPDTDNCTAALPDADVSSTPESGTAKDVIAAVDLPSTADLPRLRQRDQAASNSDKVVESQNDLFDRHTALKKQAPQTQGPVDAANALNERFDALKGPKPATPTLADLHSRLDILKGRDQQAPSLPELESRFAKLQALSGKLDRKSHTAADGQAVADFDPDVELNQQQLEALANLSPTSGSPTAADAIDSDDDLSNFVAATASLKADIDRQLQQNIQEQKQQQKAHDHQPDAPAAATPDPTQVLLSLALQDDLSEQQLHALANMGDSIDAVPAWAAAAGLSAQELSPYSDADNGVQRAPPGK